MVVHPLDLTNTGNLYIFNVVHVTPHNLQLMTYLIIRKNDN